MTATTVSDGHHFRYLALGDSYTIGESVAVDQRWPVQLASVLRARGLRLDDPQIIAVTGWTTDELETGMQQAGLERCYGLVSLSIGVNNQYRHRNLRNFRQEYDRLLQRAIYLAGGNKQRVFVLSIPDWSVTPFAQIHRSGPGPGSGSVGCLQPGQARDHRGQCVWPISISRRAHSWPQRTPRYWPPMASTLRANSMRFGLSKSSTRCRRCWKPGANCPAPIMMPFLIVPSTRNSSHLHAGPVESAVNLFIPGLSVDCT